MCRTIAICNNKGGVGKTTTVANLGYYFASQGKRVLLVDLDSQGNLTTLVSPIAIEDHIYTIMDAIKGDCKVPVDTVNENLYIIPSGLSLSGFDRFVAGEPMMYYKIYDLLEPLKVEYDYIIIDCPPAISAISYNALIASNYFLCVTSPDLLSRQGTAMIIEIANDVKKNPRYNPSLKLLGIIASKVQKNQSVDKAVLKVLKNDMNGKFFIDVILETEAAMNKANNLRKSIFEYAPSSKSAAAYAAIAKILEERMDEYEK